MLPQEDDRERKIFGDATSASLTLGFKVAF
jgi:hypothetical protein